GSQDRPVFLRSPLWYSRTARKCFREPPEHSWVARKFRLQRPPMTTGHAHGAGDAMQRLGPPVHCNAPTPLRQGTWFVRVLRGIARGEDDARKMRRNSPAPVETCLTVACGPDGKSDGKLM